jgi:hypothetical protein
VCRIGGIFQIIVVCALFYSKKPVSLSGLRNRHYAEPLRSHDDDDDDDDDDDVGRICINIGI